MMSFEMKEALREYKSLSIDLKRACEIENWSVFKHPEVIERLKYKAKRADWLKRVIDHLEIIEDRELEKEFHWRRQMVIESNHLERILGR